MQKIILSLFLGAAFFYLSCETAPAPTQIAVQEPAPVSSPQESPETPQAQATNVPVQAQGNLVNGLDMTGAGRYTVVGGDTLSQLSRRFYGSLTGVGLAGTENSFYFPLFMLASPDSNIVDPELIFPGQNLSVPDLRRNLANPVSRQAIISHLRNVANIYNRKGMQPVEEGLLRLANSL